VDSIVGAVVVFEEALIATPPGVPVRVCDTDRTFPLVADEIASDPRLRDMMLAVPFIVSPANVGLEVVSSACVPEHTRPVPEASVHVPAESVRFIMRPAVVVPSRISPPPVRDAE
jgi:hypothetical protein